MNGVELMILPCTWLIAEASFWQKFVQVLTTPSLQLFLLLGSLILATSLLLLTMTRLGHARPITKCVVLSVIAHVLLLGYAYGTKLIFEGPVAEKKVEPIQVNLIEYELPEENQPIDSANDELVDEFANTPSQPEMAQLERPELDSPFELERVFDTGSAAQEDEREFVAEPLDLAQLDSQPPQLNIKPEKVDFGELAFSEPQTDITANEIDFDRLGDSEDDISSHEPEIRSDEPQMSTELENVEINPTIVNDNAFPSNQERAQQFSSEFETPDSSQAIADAFAAATREEHSAETEELTDQPDTAEQGSPQPLVQQNQTTAPEPVKRRLGDGLEMPTAFGLRSLANRRTIAKQRGGSEETESAVDASLKWLASIQKEDGHWCPRETSAGREDKVFGHDRGGSGSNADSGITALATLAFLGAGNTHLEGEYSETVQRGLEFLIRNQRNNGDLSGNAKLFARMYCHSMSLLAISEALAMTGDHRLKQPAVRAVAYTVQAQNKRDGGWRYQAGDAGDMSQFGWIVMALHAAKLGGVNIEPATEQRMQQFLESCSSGDNGGLASYRPNEGPSTTMTAESLSCRYFLHYKPTAESLAEAQSRLLDELPDTSRINLYYWYYGTLAMYQVGGEKWDTWNNELRRVLLSQQVKSGAEAGSWEPVGLWSGYGGRVYSTAMATLCLEVYYRYEPTGRSSATAGLPSFDGLNR